MYGLSFAEIADTTPIEFDEIQQSYLLKRDLDNARYGQICAVLANLKRDPEKQSDPYTPFDFFPRLVEPEEDDIDEKNQAIILDSFYEDVRATTRIRRKKVI